jgi:TonB family protein
VRLLPFRLIVAPLVFVAACATGSRSTARVGSSRPADAPTVGCLDTLRAADTISTIVKMSVAALDPKVELPKDFESLFVQEFRSHFRMPASLPLNVVKGAEPCDSLGSRCSGGILNLGALAYATARSDGKLSDIQVVDIALTPLFADSVNSALLWMTRSEMSPPTGDKDSIPLVIQIGPEEAPDSVPAARRVFSAKIPRYDWPFTYAAMPAAGVNADYPFAARLANVEDSVTLAFTVDADGAIAAESIELVSANYRDFVTSVLNALSRTRYHPAHLGDCAVATRMKQRFLFKVPE